MLINARHAEEIRVAVIDDTRLESYQVERADSGLTRGNIYRGVVANIQPSLNAAFVDYGAERNGFLTIGDVVADAYHRKPKKGERPRIEQVLEKGRPILVQVTKDPVGSKGAALTTSISLAGRYLVLTPFEGSLGVSRKAEDNSMRKEVKERVESLKVPAGCGLIVRTNGLEQNKTTLNRDLAALGRLWKQIVKEQAKGKKPALLYSDQDLIVEALRDYLDTSVAEVYVDNSEIHEKAAAYMRAFMPRAKTVLHFYDERLPLFTRFHLETQIDRIYERTVGLPSGGSISIDATEALTAIDVNSGRSLKASSQAETALQTNLEAASEVGRQLRLRDIGGLIVVDFIDMRQRKNERKVENALRDAMKPDKARVSIGRISSNGLLEVNRQSIKKALQLRTRRPCPTCNGIGSISSPEVMSLNLLRRIEARAASGRLRGVRIHLAPELADAFQNHHRRELTTFEDEFEITIEIFSSPMMPLSEQRVSWIEREGAPRLDRPSILPAEPLVAKAADALEEEKPSRRRRGGRRRKSAAAAEAKAETQAEEVSEERDDDEAKEGSRPEKSARSRGRSRRRRSRAAEPSSSETEKSASKSEDKESQEAPKSTGRKTRSTRRRSSKRADGEKAADQEATPSEPDSEEEDSKETRARRTRRRGTLRSQVEKATASEPESQADEPPPPRKRIRRRPRPQPEPVEAAPESSGGDEGQAERRPRRRRRTRATEKDPAETPTAS